MKLKTIPHVLLVECTRKSEMKIILIVSVIFLFMLDEPGIGQSVNRVPIISFTQLEPSLNFQNDTTYVLNFWATWCVPCRKELPAFEQIHKNYSTQKVKVIL